MSDTTHVTWIIPRAVVPAAMFADSETQYTTGNVVRLEMLHCDPLVALEKLEAAGIHYLMWQEGHLGSYGPSVRVFDEQGAVEVSCNEDGGATTEVSYAPDGAIQFRELSAVLTYLTRANDFLRKHGVTTGVSHLGSGFTEAHVLESV